MKWRIGVQALGLWAGWFLATWLKDMKVFGDKNDLEQVRPRHDHRREQPIAARKVGLSVMGYALFVGQVAVFAGSLASRSVQRRGRLTILSLVLLVPMTTAVNAVLPELQRAHVRMHYEMIKDFYSKNVTFISSVSYRRRKAA